jgi:hypothetical protein
MKNRILNTGNVIGVSNHKQCVAYCEDSNVTIAKHSSAASSIIRPDVAEV